ncbi:Zinc finger BED domain-containing protein 4 [Eumeta japonica]|uniref:Zinc finger BED domain-containing protein 4 n=1 Tax=Eumeta variegata TaxID=151549 RepID=A0A4C1UB08_EUMVA|nr:Zinc finger BED domain-containing protein 4 [Eumeta japonica]
MIAEMIALQNLRFSFVEGTGFRRLMNALPKYKLRGRDYFFSFVCDNLYNPLAKKVKDLLVEFDKLSFTTDIWFDLHSGISLLTLTAHGISEDFCKKNKILKCEVMDERHTGAVISIKFQAILEEWRIHHQKDCMVRHRGSNMVRGMQLAGLEDISCTIHQIQLCIRAGVESQEWLLQLTTKLRKIITHFNHSLVAQAELIKIQKECLNQSASSVIQDCPTL